MDTNIGEIIKSIRDKDLLLYKNCTYRKVHESKNCSIRWRCTVRTCTTIMTDFYIFYYLTTI